MERQITRNIRIHLDALREDVNSQKPLFAINWFNTRAMWLYNLYNLVAARSVFKIGGRPLIKGQITQTLTGEENQTRQVLLIVNYPNGERFLDLLSSRYFQVTSLLRMLAVRDFSFVLNHAVHSPEVTESESQPPGGAWAIHHYSSDQDAAEELLTVQQMTKEAGVTLFFSSHPAFAVRSTDLQGRTTSQDAVTDRVIVLKANRDEVITDAVQGPYGKFVASVRNSYVGLFKRSL